MPFQSISTPGQLLELDANSTPYLFDEFIKIEKWGERRLSKRKLAVLKTINPVVEKLLQPGEQVFYISDGVRTSNFEQLFIGWVAYYYNLMAFAFTSDRILLIHLKSRKKRGIYLGSINYTDIGQVKSSLFGGFKLKFTNGKSLYFTRMPRADRKRVSSYMNSVLGETLPPKSKTSHGMKHLCPSCQHEHLKVVPSCPGCSTEFKTPGKAALLSLVMPGLGDIYLKSRVLGTIELLFMLWIWTSFIFSAVDSVGYGEDPVSSYGALVLLFLFVHPIDALKSYIMGKKGLIPIRTEKG